MGQLNHDADDIIQVKMKMTKIDYYLSQVYGQFMSPYVFIFLAIFLWLNYLDFKYFRIDQDYVFLALSVALNVLWVLGIIYLFPFIILIFHIATNRLKGVLGDHELIFRQNDFIEKTEHNEQSITYGSVIKLLKIKSRYFLYLQGSHFFLFHKNYLPETVLSKINRISNDTFKPKKFLIPSVAFILFILSFVSIGVMYPLSKHTVHTNRIPFFVTWNDEALYIFGGETVSGYTEKYVTLPFIQDRKDNLSEPLSSTDLFLWVVENMEINRYELKNIANPGTVYLLDKKLYFISFDGHAGRKLFVWQGKVFQELEDVENILTRIEEDRMNRSKANLNNMVSEFNWHEIIGKDGTLKVSLHGKQFMLRIKKDINYERELIPSEQFVLTACWPDSSSTFDVIYSGQYGRLNMDKDKFDNTFGL